MASNNNNSNQMVVPEARAAMDRFKMEAAAEVGVNLKDGYNGELTSRQAGSIGGQMVKKMIQAYEEKISQHAAEPICPMFNLLTYKNRKMQTKQFKFSSV